jgi:phosphoribosylaminoimidazolecarboxamide formyltransferase / IMP cyclohydrolase
MYSHEPPCAVQWVMRARESCTSAAKLIAWRLQGDHINRVGTIDDRVRVKTILVSVFDKAGLDAFARGLLSAVPDALILSTGGTFTALDKALGAAAARCLRQVSDYTGQPEMQGGLVKTLDFKIYLGLLAETDNPEHQRDLSRAGAVHIDMVICNLYPFETASAAAGATLEDARANIDIGGPCMIRAAAKNFHRVAAVTDPGEYPQLLRELSAHRGSLSLDTRFRLARSAFRRIARYDEAIAGYLDAADPAASRAAYTIRTGS